MWLKKAANGVMKAIRSTSWGLYSIGRVALLAMMALTFMDVFLRYAFDRPIVGGTEVTQYLMVCMITGAAWCALQDRHIKMNLFIERLPARAQAAIDVFTLMVSLIVYGITAWRTLLQGIYVQESGLESSMLQIPAYPFYWVLGLSLLLMALVIISYIAGNVAKMVKR